MRALIFLGLIPVVSILTIGFIELHSALRQKSNL